MKGLDTLIRLHRWRLDEGRRRLGELERLASDLRRRLNDLEAELRTEQAVAGRSLEAGLTFAAYAASVRARRARMTESLDEVEAQITTAHQAVTAAYRELKGYELVAENKRRRAELEAKRAQQRTLDDLGGELHRRGRAAETNFSK